MNHIAKANDKMKIINYDTYKVIILKIIRSKDKVKVLVKVRFALTGR